ncbi:hypothetical protein QYF61_007314 [Mycteria americana]|uniref:Rapamycin-insensitive companion of mTOR N-terminal domain-containing protein n=1 Tax=Mycteria americana TaxID=33587 RepID=A0AAN7N8H6_MYCAM|nr:hypothetical protein QYF61_007314 [Mycteria americana]
MLFQQGLLEVLYDIFRLPLPVVAEEFIEALLSIDPSRFQDCWRLSDGFVAAEAKTILPHRARSRPDLMDNYLALVLSAFITNGLLEGLVEVITSSDDHVSVRATILLGELLHMAKQPQVPQTLLIRLVLLTLPQLRCPSLDMLQHLNVSLVVGGPTLNTVFEVRPHQCRVQGHDHFPSPAGHTIFDTSQDAIGFLGHLGTLLAHIQAAVNKHPQVLLCLAAFQPLFPKPVALHGVVVVQVQDLALGLVEPHTIGPSPSIQPVQVPLQSLPPLQQINTPTQLGVICKLPESALDPFVQIIDKDIKQEWPQH